MIFQLSCTHCHTIQKQSTLAAKRYFTDDGSIFFMYSCVKCGKDIVAKANKMRLTKEQMERMKKGSQKEMRKKF